MPLHKRGTRPRRAARLGLRRQGPVDQPAVAIDSPKARCGPSRCLPVHLRRTAAGRQRSPEPGHLLPDLGGGRGPQADGSLHQQEHDRQGRVPPDGRDRAPVRPDAGRPVERPRGQARPVGCSAIGSSEACMLGGMAAKWRWRAKREAAGKSTDKPNMVCGPVQVVWHKFAKYWDVEMREIPMSPGKYCMDVEQMLAQVDENTIMVVPTFGVTYTGCLRAGASSWPRPSTSWPRTPGSTSTSTWTGPAAPSWPRSAPPTSSGTSGSRGSSRSAPRATSSVWPPSGRGGCCGGTRRTCPTTSSSMSPTWAATCPSSRSTSPGRPARSWPSTTTSCDWGSRATRTSTTPATPPAKFLAEEIVKLGPFELLCDGNPLTGIPSVAWRIKEGEDPGLHPLRRRRPPAGQGLAGPGLPADRIGGRHLGAADPGAPGGQPGPGLPPPRRHPSSRSTTSPSTR